MANATVEKLKALGIRHGEKAVVALTGTLLLLFLVLAVAKPTIDLTADQVKDDANKADQNLKKHQSDEDILTILENDGIKNQGFEKVVASQEKTTIDASKYALNGSPWVTLEPGAGLIRDMPVLIAPTDLYARPGRGGAAVFQLDENGERKVKLVKDDSKTKKHRRKHGRRRPAMGGGGYAGMRGAGGGYGQMRGGGRKKSAADLAKEKKEQEEKATRLKGSLAGKSDASDDESKDDKQKNANSDDYVTITEGQRWVALVALVDNKKLRENYATALKTDFSVSYPEFDRLDAERQQLNDDGNWTDWQAVDREANLKVLDNIAETDDELTPDEVRLETITDFLPFLRAGYWKGVHIASLVPKEKLETKTDTTAQNNIAGIGSMGGGAGYAMGSGSYGGANMKSSSGNSYGSSSSAGYGRSVAGIGSVGNMTENTNFPKSDSEEVMARALDFTVEPAATYRYRVRLVVVNPNKNHEDVSPGVDTTADELFGPWSEPSEPVAVPDDVTAYAMSKNRDSVKETGSVHFMVARWTPDDGMTVYQNFDASPGQILGDPHNKTVPVLDDDDSPKGKDEATRMKMVDFNTHQVVLDTDGGTRPTPRITGLVGNTYDAPAMALMLRPDGAVVVRDQAVDSHNDEMKEMKGIYDKALKEAEGKDKKPAAGGMGGYGMGGGYGGGSGGRR
ncbi:MAG TPA: hypothetical protein VGZ22_09565 [Isosphaeraceae bacterium]|nr:hypothetical protein [Isosphaeraceae bacterium]